MRLLRNIMRFIPKIDFSCEDGFTLAEALSSLILLSILMILLVKMALSLPFSFLSDKNGAASLRRQWILYRTLEKEIDLVQPPWWVKEYKPEQQGLVWTFPWYQGEEEQELILEWKDSSWQFRSYEHTLISINMPFEEPPETAWITDEDGYNYFQIVSDDLAGGRWIFPAGCTSLRKGEEKP